MSYIMVIAAVTLVILLVNNYTMQETVADNDGDKAIISQLVCCNKIDWLRQPANSVATVDDLYRAFMANLDLDCFIEVLNKDFEKQLDWILDGEEYMLPY